MVLLCNFDNAEEAKRQKRGVERVSEGVEPCSQLKKMGERMRGMKGEFFRRGSGNCHYTRVLTRLLPDDGFAPIG